MRQCSYCAPWVLGRRLAVAQRRIGFGDAIADDPRGLTVEGDVVVDLTPQPARLSCAHDEPSERRLGRQLEGRAKVPMDEVDARGQWIDQWIGRAPEVDHWQRIIVGVEYLLPEIVIRRIEPETKGIGAGHDMGRGLPQDREIEVA